MPKSKLELDDVGCERASVSGIVISMQTGESSPVSEARWNARTTSLAAWLRAQWELERGVPGSPVQHAKPGRIELDTGQLQATPLKGESHAA